jgi:hypothetical protein
MRRTPLAWLLSLLLLGLLASQLASQEPPKPPTPAQADAKSQAKATSEAQASGEKDAKDKNGEEDFKDKNKDQKESKDESKPSPPIPLLPQLLVIGKIDALCASDQYLVRIRPLGPQFAGGPPCPPWLLVDSKKTPQAPSLLQKAAEESWTVAVYYDPTWTVTAVCVRFFPEKND